MVIDQHPVIAEFIEPDQSELHPAELTSYDEVWFKDHVRTSQYYLQIVKCDNSECCLPGEVHSVQLFLKGSFQLLYRLLKP